MTTPPLGFLLSHLGEVLREDTVKALADFGITPREYGVLWRLEVHGPLSQRRLGELHRIDRTTVVAVVDHLEAMELVVRAPDPDDRRRHALRLTDHGRNRLAEATAEVQRVEAAFLAPLAEPDRRRLSELLVTVLDDGAGR